MNNPKSSSITTHSRFAIIEVATGAVVFEPRYVHMDNTTNLQIANDRRYLYTASWDNTGLVFSMNPFDYALNNERLYEKVEQKDWWAALGPDAQPELAYRAI